jgi:prepilin-type processing-associated H-X9-DG protein
MLPFIEQGTMYNAFNFAIGAEGTLLISGFPFGYVVNSTVHTTRIPSFQCPSDTPQLFSFAAISAASGGLVPAFPWSATKGNYGANWGNCDYGQGAAGGYFTRNLYLQSPFGINASATGPMTITMAAITDGTSNTHIVSEILQGAPDDLRGTIWVDNPGAGTYMTRFTPNGYQDYVPLYQPWASAIPAASLVGDNVDNLPTFVGSSAGTSPPTPGSLCDSQPTQQLACFNQGSQGGEFAGSRSRHPGGVNSLFGDGSVHFMKNTVNALTWVQLGSTNGGEVISADQY